MDEHQQRQKLVDYLVKASPSTKAERRPSRAEASEYSSDEESEELRRMTSAAVGRKGPLHEEGQSNNGLLLLPWASALVWPLMMTVPLLLSSPYSPVSYKNLFPPSWYEYDGASSSKPKPLGLLLGLLSVLVGQVSVWIVFYLFKFGYLTPSSISSTSSELASRNTEPLSVQTKGARPYEFFEGLMTHICQPEGFVLLIAYLSSTWMLRLMPHSYYDFEGTIQWEQLFMCLVLQDGIQFAMHLLEHVVSPAYYQMSHKPHHRFINPRLFDAFNGSLPDTLCMIIIPLFMTANIMRSSNVWTYMAFGSTYASWLTLIHSEYAFPWDNALFRKIGFGTPADHHVHHKFFKYNYGHLFMWFDRLAGTYRDPKQFAPKVFRDGV